MKKLLISAILFFTSMSAMAGTAVFGMELGKTTYDEAQKAYGGKNVGVNKFSSGPMLEVSSSNFNFDGLKEVTLIFDQQKMLVSVLTTLDKSRYYEVHGMLKSKYKVISANIPNLGNKLAIYKNMNDEIRLSAPHLSFDMSLNYFTSDFIKNHKRITAEEEKQKAAGEARQL